MNKKQTVIIVMIVVLLLALIGVGIWVGVSLNNQPEETKPNPGGVQLAPNQGAYNPDGNSGTASQGVAIPGWGKIHHPRERNGSYRGFQQSRAEQRPVLSDL